MAELAHVVVAPSINFALHVNGESGGLLRVLAYLAVYKIDLVHV
jgi:hypothetical protein